MAWNADTKEDGRQRVETMNGEKTHKARYKMEKHLGRELKPYEVVHHINGDPTDDRISNLMLMSKSEHNSLHHAGSTHDYPEDHDTPKISDTKERLIIEIADYMEENESFVNNSEIARALDISSMTVRRRLV